MKSLKSITLFTKINQFCDNQSPKFLKLTIFSSKSPIKCWSCSNIPRIPPPTWLNVVLSPEKLCHVVVVRNDQANFQPTLNKDSGGASLTIFATDCLQNEKSFERGFLKTQNFFFFLKNLAIFKRGLCRHAC